MSTIFHSHPSKISALSTKSHTQLYILLPVKACSGPEALRARGSPGRQSDSDSLPDCASGSKWPLILPAVSVSASPADYIAWHMILALIRVWHDWLESLMVIFLALVIKLASAPRPFSDHDARQSKKTV